MSGDILIRSGANLVSLQQICPNRVLLVVFWKNSQTLFQQISTNTKSTSYLNFYGVGFILSFISKKMASAEKDDDASAPPSDDEVDNKNQVFILVFFP